MVTGNLELRHNSAKLAEKDPFDLKEIKIIKDLRDYYASIISSFIHIAFMNAPGLKCWCPMNLHFASRGLYFYENEKPSAVLTTYSEERNRFQPGDNHVSFTDIRLHAKICTLMKIIREIEENEWIPIPEPKKNPSPEWEYKTDIIDFLYFAPENQNPYFIFDFHSNEKRRVVKRKAV